MLPKCTNFMECISTALLERGYLSWSFADWLNVTDLGVSTWCVPISDQLSISANIYRSTSRYLVVEGVGPFLETAWQRECGTLRCKASLVVASGKFSLSVPRSLVLSALQLRSVNIDDILVSPRRW